MATTRGIDVSAYQNPQDWAGHKVDGVVFAFAKASEGQRSRDDMFARHIKGIIAAGLVPGAYHYGWPIQDPALEAANYIAAVKPYASAGFLHWLDLERRSDGANYKGRSAAQIKAWAAKWLDLVQEAFPGQRVGVYASGDDLSKQHVPDGVPLWYPAYTWGYTAVSYSKAEAASRPKPSGWSPLFWQFTSTPLDRSICYLSEADLRTWAAGTEEIDMALTADDIKLLAGKDGIFVAPSDATDYSPDPDNANHYWAFGTHVQSTTTKVRNIEKTLAEVKATVDGLAVGGIDLDALAAKVADLLAARLAN